jgi:CheY-specific phosphatase CheX
MKRVTERDQIRLRVQTKNEQLKAEAIDILIDAIHRQTRGGATVSFDHNLALKIEKLIIGNMRRAQIIALVRAGIHEAKRGPASHRSDILPIPTRAAHMDLPAKASRHA